MSHYEVAGRHGEAGGSSTDVGSCRSGFRSCGGSGRGGSGGGAGGDAIYQEVSAPYEEGSARYEEGSTIDELLIEHIGQCGRGQVLMVALASLTFVPMSMTLMLMVFLTADPVDTRMWRCVGVDEECTALLESSGPLGSTFCALLPEGSGDGARYEWTQREDSVVSDFQLVCDSAWKVPFVNSFYFLCLACGGPLFGTISDHFGRRTALYIAVLLTGLATVLTGSSTGYWGYFAWRAMSALAVQGIPVASVALTTELVGPEYRGRVGIACQACFILGEFALAALCYLIRPWRSACYWCAAFSFVLLPSAFIVPESPRWMLSKGHASQALKALRLIANLNGSQLPASATLCDRHSCDNGRREREPGAERQEGGEGEGLPLILSKSCKALHKPGARDGALQKAVQLSRGLELEETHLSDSASDLPWRMRVGQTADARLAKEVEIQPVTLSRADADSAAELSRCKGSALQSAETQPELLSQLGADSAAELAQCRGLALQSSEIQLLYPNLETRRYNDCAAHELPKEAVQFERAQGAPSECGDQAISSLAKALPDPSCPPQALHLSTALRDRLVLTLLLVLSFTYLSIVMSFFGLSFALHSLAGNPYLNFFLLALAEIPSVVITLFIDHVGRVVLLVSGLATAGVSCALCAIVPGSWSIMFASGGKLGAAAAGPTLIVYSNEVFPTSVRSSLFGTIAVAGRMGGVAAPYLFLIASRSGVVEVPFWSMGVAAVAASLLCIVMLPESKGLPVPRALQDMVAMSRRPEARLWSKWRRWLAGGKATGVRGRWREEACEEDSEQLLPTV